MEKVGWCSLRPVDIADDERCDLADPMFFRMVHAVLASGRVELLHLGPPCAYFSVAVSPPTALAFRALRPLHAVGQGPRQGGSKHSPHACGH